MNKLEKPLTQSTAMVLAALGLAACQPLASKPVGPQADAHVLGVMGHLDIQMLEMAYQPAQLQVPKAGRYEVHVTNVSPYTHDIVFSEGTRLVAEPGQSASAIIDIPASGLAYRCSLPGHEQAGMKGRVGVAGQTAAAVEKPAQGPAGPVPVAAEDYFDPKAPPRLLGKVHNVELVAIEKSMAVAKGVTQQLWTYNGQVPGPVLRVKVGDTVRVHFVNPASNKLPHSVDFHASQVAWNDKMASIKPGEEKMYEWHADYAGVWMYHCGTNPALHHIASGMYGMVIVEPPEGLAPVDHEFALVQSEFYTGPQGGETDLHKAAASHASPDVVAFNGVANQYKEHPIEVGTGKKVRIFVLDAGPNEDSAFHIVGTIFNRVIKEGMELVPGNKGHWGSQAVDLAPSQGAIVELTTAEDGLYPIVTHAFNFVGKGALGLLKAGDGDPKN